MFSPIFFARILGLMVCAMSAVMITGSAGEAALKICNKTQARIGIAIGSAQDLSLASQGWFNVKPGACEDVLRGDLAAGPYFIHAIDYDRGGEWGGPELMCVSDGEFQIDGTQDCYARGYTRAGFRRIETNGQKHWSLDLTDGNRGSAGGNE
jgi:uncharacterized membrane protein